MNDVIVFDEVSKRFGKTVALDKVTFQVPRGAVFGLLGENGAGKTTAIRLMLGLGLADSGKITVLGMDCHRQGLAIRGRVGYVAERPAFYEWMSANQAGWFCSGFYPDGYRSRFHHQLKRFGVDAGQRIRYMSKGTRARLALSLALATDPPLLVLDEPTSGLDTIVRHDFLDSMVDLAAEGRTIFLSSHQIHEVERVADMIAILRAGRILVCEPLDQLKSTSTVMTVTYRELPKVSHALPGVVLSRQTSGYQCHCVVRHTSREGMSQLQQDPNVVSVDTRCPTLEELYIAYMRMGKEDAAKPSLHDDSSALETVR